MIKVLNSLKLQYVHPKGITKKQVVNTQTRHCQFDPTLSNCRFCCSIWALNLRQKCTAATPGWLFLQYQPAQTRGFNTGFLNSNLTCMLPNSKWLKPHKSVMKTGLVRVSSEIIQFRGSIILNHSCIWQVKQLIFDCQPKNIILHLTCFLLLNIYIHWTCLCVFVLDTSVSCIPPEHPEHLYKPDHKFTSP